MLIQKSKNTYMFLNRIMKIQIDIYEEINIYVCTEIKKNRIVEIKKEAPQWEGASFHPFRGSISHSNWMDAACHYKRPRLMLRLLNRKQRYEKPPYK